MFTLSTADFSRSPSTTKSVHQSNNSTNTSNNIQDSLLKLNNSSKELPHLNTKTLIEDNFCDIKDIKEDKKNQYPVPFPRTKFLNINASRPMYEISPEKRQCIEDNFNTKIDRKNHNTVLTQSTESNALSYEDDYYNKYKANKWTFMSNFRDEESPVFANEVTAYQYELVAKENRFYGELPQTIKRKNVVNEETLSLTEGKHGEELYNIFFEKTPNGKSTKRIMDNFGLHAKEVRRVDKETTYRNTPKIITDFYIDIAPANSKATTQ